MTDEVRVPVETETAGAEEAPAAASAEPSAPPAAASEAPGIVIEEESPGLGEVERQLAEVAAERDRLRDQLGRFRDNLLRTAADFDNFRKRAARQEADAAETARMDVMRRMLPVVDNIERALEFAGTDTGPMAEGLRLVLRSFQDAFAPLGLERVEAKGQAFDPQLHEAMGQAETAEVPAGTVFQQYQPGYTVGGRLLRPALVIVARPPRPVEAEASPPGGGSTEASDGGSGGGE